MHVFGGPTRMAFRFRPGCCGPGSTSLPNVVRIDHRTAFLSVRDLPLGRTYSSTPQRTAVYETRLACPERS